MIGKYLPVIVLSTVFALGNTAPRRTRETSGTNWRQPCASDVQFEASSGDAFVPDPDLTIGNVKQNLKFLIRDYEHSCVERDYEMPIEQRHYLPNGVPNKTDIGELQNLTGPEASEIFEKLPMLYTDLQKFGVAFEELIVDVSKTNDATSLKQTQLAILRMMCELGGLLTDPIVPIESFTLRPGPETQDAETYVKTRAWGVVFRFKAYLEAWKFLLGIEQQPQSDCPASSGV